MIEKIYFLTTKAIQKYWILLTVGVVALGAWAYATAASPLTPPKQEEPTPPPAMAWTMVYDLKSHDFAPGAVLRIGTLRKLPLLGDTDLVTVYSYVPDGSQNRLGLALNKTFALGLDATVGGSFGFRIAEDQKPSFYFGISLATR